MGPPLSYLEKPRPPGCFPAACPPAPRPDAPAAPGRAPWALTFSSTSWRSWSHSRVSGFSRFSVQRRARRSDSP